MPPGILPCNLGLKQTTRIPPATLRPPRPGLRSSALHERKEGRNTARVASRPVPVVRGAPTPAPHVLPCAVASGGLLTHAALASPAGRAHQPLPPPPPTRTGRAPRMPSVGACDASLYAMPWKETSTGVVAVAPVVDVSALDGSGPLTSWRRTWSERRQWFLMAPGRYRETMCACSCRLGRWKTRGEGDRNVFLRAEMSSFLLAETVVSVVENLGSFLKVSEKERER